MSKFRSWDDSFAALREYKCRTGSLVVKAKEDKKLQRWVLFQRKNKNDLTREQRTKLESIGFDVNSQRCFADWDARFEQLLQFKQQHGHFQLPYSRTSDPSSPNYQLHRLETWVYGQRSSYKKGTLRKERQSKLEAIGFVWKMSRGRRLKAAAGKKKINNKVQAINEAKAASTKCVAQPTEMETEIIDVDALPEEEPAVNNPLPEQTAAAANNATRANKAGESTIFNQGLMYPAKPPNAVDDVSTQKGAGAPPSPSSLISLLSAKPYSKRFPWSHPLNTFTI